jgi:hypothetical protein
MPQKKGSGGKSKKASPGKVRSLRAGSKFKKLPGGGYEGRVKPKVRMRKVKAAPAYNPKKGKVTKRKYGGKTRLSK